MFFYEPNETRMPQLPISLAIWLVGAKSEEKKSFKISIKDNGPGLLFEPKQGNLEPGSSTKKFGTGLGIPVAFKICQSHGWELTFNSNERGTEVVITCPQKNNEIDKYDNR